MKGTIEELWHGNIIPHEDSRTNSKEMKELLGYIARHHEDLEKSFTDEQKEIFEKFHDCWSEYASLRAVGARTSKCRPKHPNPHQGRNLSLIKASTDGRERARSIRSVRTCGKDGTRRSSTVNA